MKKGIKIFLIVLLVVIIIYIGIVVYTNNHYKEIKTIEEKEYEYVYKYNKYTVTINKYRVYNMQCIKAPCPNKSKNLIAIYTVPLTKKYKDLLADETPAYEIIKEDQDSGVKQKGYKVNKSKNSVSIYIGEKNNGGYGIKVLDAEVNNSKFAIIRIEETHPGGVATMALTQPMIEIKFRDKFNDVQVSDSEGLLEEISD